jgi:hypothetical protein
MLDMLFGKKMPLKMLKTMPAYGSEGYTNVVGLRIQFLVLHYPYFQKTSRSHNSHFKRGSTVLQIYILYSRPVLGRAWTRTRFTRVSHPIGPNPSPDRMAKW